MNAGRIYPIRLLMYHPQRLVLTVGGIALCIFLLLLLLAIYRGVADGSVEYIRRNQADLWVLQRNATNILRGSSILSTGHGVILREVSGVRSASAVLLILSGVRHGSREGTVFLAGYDAETGTGGPPEILFGRAVRSDDEIVLDRAFALKFGMHVGDTLRVQDEKLRVVGLSGGTNASVIQYAFVTLRRAQALVAVPGVVTCYLVSVEEGVPAARVAQAVREELPGLEVYDHDTFLQNNIREMESGFLPLLSTVVVIGVVVLTVILCLLLTITILERRRDFAVLKALGSSNGFLRGVVVRLSLAITALSSGAALVMFFPLVAFLERVAPEVSTRLTVAQCGFALAVVVLMSLLGAALSMRRLRRIYALEAFA